MSWSEKGAKLGKWAKENFDVALVMLLAAAVLILEAVTKPDHELVESAILAVLGITALALLRDRQKRSQLDEIASFVRDFRSDRPYDVQAEANRWVINDGGGHAVFTKTQLLRFTRNEVSTMEHWCTGLAGTVEQCQAEWRLSSEEPWIGATTIHDFGIHNGRNYIFSLDTERSRGDTLLWRVTRVLVNRFPEDRESVSLKLQARSHRPKMEVVWPRDREPQLVEFRIDDGTGRALSPRRREDGRLFVEEQLAHNATGSIARIEWTW